MQENQLFEKTRWQLACWYAGVMGVILSICGFGVYEAIAHAHQITLDRELESVAGTIHDSLETVLEEPGILAPDLRRFLPDLCIATEKCATEPRNPHLHLVGAIAQGNYYLRLVNLSGNVVALAGIHPPGLSTQAIPKKWETVVDGNGIRYHQISVTLHTQDYRDWGYLQLGRSLAEWEHYLSFVKLSLIFGLPLALLLVGFASWWLAGLAMQPIYQSYQQIQQFTADAAHELRTPLAAVRATVESTLRMPQLNEGEIRETLHSINRQNHRLSQLVKDLLWLSRMDRKIRFKEKKLCCLNDIISDIQEELAALAIAANLTLIKNINVAQPLTIVADEEQLYRLVMNLVSNAIQYSHPGGEVTLILEKSASDAIIQIQDTGIGISPEEQTRIFDRFYRVNSDRSRTTGGAGLGLAIAEAIVKNHNGQIQVQSELEKGSIFTIRLPLAKSSPPFGKKIKPAKI
jgi:signal transduction histidine kinase